LLFNENIFEELTKYRSRETQTKLFATLLPQSLLSEMKPAKIEARTSMNLTRTCQMNTLSYLIKTNESQIDLQDLKEEDILDVQQMNHSTSTSLIDTKTGSIEILSSEEKDFSIKSSTEIQYQSLTDCKYDEQGINISTIQFEGGELLDDDVEKEKINSTLMNGEILPNENHQKEFILTLSPSKCVNTCGTVDLDEPNALVTSSSFDNGIISTRISSDELIHTINLQHIDTKHEKYSKFINNSNIDILE
jgi:hypothetical protein